ncbi:MAG: carboxypeptidase regulatory-like domain-containing protein [Pyrinomonadaceae bacterium]|nr:carboxypeptidase regulatory-like domain-containing protein [Pyrinomonadaceae bacterium]
MKPINIEDLKVAKPCGVGWGQMTGDKKLRRCDLCELNVYNVEEMTKREVIRLLSKPNGRICGRLRRRADGTIITRQCPKGLRDYGKRVARFAGAALSAVLALFSISYGQAKSGSGRSLETRIERVEAEKSSIAAVIQIFGSSSLSDVEFVFHREGQDTRTVVKSNDSGKFETGDLTPGVYVVEVSIPGKWSTKIQRLVLKENEAVRLIIKTRPLPDSIVRSASGAKYVVLRGSITDESGAVVQGALVTVRSLDGASFFSKVTNERGQFHIGVFEGFYKIEAKLEGFETITIPEFEISRKGSSRLPITLKASNPVLKGPRIIGDEIVLWGVITDSAGAIVPGTKITLRNRSTKKTLKITSDENGIFATEDLPTGTYELKIKSPGFKTYRVKELKIVQGEAKKLNVSLEPKDITVTVGIFTTEPTIDMGKTDITTTVFSRDNE